MENSLAQKIRQALNGSALMAKAASDSEVSGAEEGVKLEQASSPEAAQSGAVSDVTAGTITGPGENSNVSEGTPAVAENTIGDDSGASEDLDEEAIKLLKTQKEPVTKESLDMVDKVASAVNKMAQRLSEGLKSETLVNSFSKTASAEDVSALLVKMASEGNVGAQQAVDFIASYNYGIAKKANDLEALTGEGATPEEVMAVEDALNQGAIENPEDVVADAGEGEGEGCENGECEGSCEGGECYGGEDVDPEVMQALQDISAQIEGEAQQAVVEIASAILDEDPSISEEEAVEAAQEAVVDALETIDAQQAIGAVDENGEYQVPDDVAADAVAEMQKSASAFPLRDHICTYLNNRFNLDPSAFAGRL